MATHHSAASPLCMGESQGGMELVYETWGELNEEKDKAILLHTGLSASSSGLPHTER